MVLSKQYFPLATDILICLFYHDYHHWSHGEPPRHHLHYHVLIMRMRTNIKNLGIDLKDWRWGLVNSGSSLAVGVGGLLEEPMAWQEEFAQEELTTTTTETSAALPTRLWHMSWLSLLSLLSSLSLSLSLLLSCKAYILWLWILIQAVISPSKTDLKTRFKYMSPSCEW